MANGGLGALMRGTGRDREEHLFLTWNSVPVGGSLGSGSDGVQSVMTFHLGGCWLNHNLYFLCGISPRCAQWISRV